MMLLLAASAGLALTHSMYQANLGVWSWTLVIQRRRLLLPGRHQQLAVSTRSWLDWGQIKHTCNPGLDSQTEAGS